MGEMFCVRVTAVGGDLYECALAGSDESSGFFESPRSERFRDRIPFYFVKAQFGQATRNAEFADDIFDLGAIGGVR